MMTIKEIKEILKDYKNTEKIFIAKKIELKRMEKQKEQLFDVGAAKLSDMPRSKNTADPTFEKFWEASIRFESVIERLKDDISFLNKKMKKTERNIKVLPAFEYTLIEQKFIVGKAWGQIANELNFNERYLFKVLKRAFNLLAESWK